MTNIGGIVGPLWEYVFCLAMLCISSVGVTRPWCLKLLQPRLGSILEVSLGDRSLSLNMS